MSNGGPAFPTPEFIDHWGTTHSSEGGMSLRDYFAIRALHDDLSLPQTAEEAAKLCDVTVAEYGAKQWVAAHGMSSLTP